MKIVNGSSLEFRRWMSTLDARRNDESENAKRVAAHVIERVRNEGDRAVAAILREFDRVDLEPSDILERRSAGIPAGRREGFQPSHDFRSIAELAIARVTEFHKRQTVSGYAYEENGSRFEHLVRPLRRVGIYVPGGRAVYLSTLIMCAVPAKLAGVRELVVATTPTAAADPQFRDLCGLLGVTEVYRSGGPAGIAALALGTETLRRVDKIVGPGNSYVNAAKELLIGKVGLDMTAGPTEVVIIADRESEAELVASDLLAQAEHGDDSTVICVTDSPTFAERLKDVVARRLAGAASNSAAQRSIPANGWIVLLDDIGEAVSIVNEIGPEHVSIQVQPERIDLDAIENCGAIFVGPYAPVAIGDYIAGPNHVLPTAGAGRFFSPLGVYDFVKRSNRVTLSRETFDAIGDAGAQLADLEGLPLHAASMRCRDSLKFILSEAKDLVEESKK